MSEFLLQVLFLLNRHPMDLQVCPPTVLFSVVQLIAQTFYLGCLFMDNSFQVIDLLRTPGDLFMTALTLSKDSVILRRHERD
ncbi:hypothetical protein HPB48_019903 [Haemaphysalis longicornis]|uniref:Uncharacterized protein n=1 Tax=Haemaphysalis longicornis TaxID=44386 RepID=A0A9J6FTM6_HAELO|nr:hypothetical protein HPB48_019903 [Haemaphysalis longicornis]